MSTRPSPERFRGLHVLVDDDPRWTRDPVAQARTACRGGAAVVQLRVKHATDHDSLAWAEEIRAMTRAAGALFVMNDRFDLALACGADAVHLGQDDLPPASLPESVRAVLGIGRSTHDPDQLARAAEEPCDYVAFGPVFGTRSKDSPYDARGLDALRAAVSVVAPKPLVAIGGIGRENLAAVIEAGASAAAVISAVAASEAPEAETRALQAMFSV